MVLKEIQADEIYTKYKELKREHVQSLQEWLSKQPHLPQLKEIYLMQFLYYCNYNNEKAKTMIDNFATIWAHFPELARHRDPYHIKNIFDSISVILLPKKTPEDYHVTMIRTLTPDASKYNFDHALQYLDMFISMHKESVGVSPGQYIIVDAKNYNLSHITKVNVVSLKKFLRYIEEGLPTIIRGLHLININSAMEKIITMSKPLMRSDLFKLIYPHSNIEDLYKYVPKDCLPSEYDGADYSAAQLHEEQVKLMLDNADFFRSETFSADESKRPGKPRREGEIFGIEGTFKKLDID